jgi:predicted ArsR family transcriptional regulator
MDVTKEISPELVHIFDHMHLNDGWWSAVEVARKIEVPGRTVRHHLARLAAMGVLEVQKLHRGYRYKFRPGANPELIDRLRRAAEAFAFAETS